MAKQVQFRRGSETENDNFTGAAGEITVNTTNKSLRVHDGIIAGGTALETYVKPSAEPISYITNLQTTLDAKESADATILKDADIGVTVQSYDATIVVDADIGVTVQAYDADIATNADVSTAISSLVDSAPGTLDTLNELAAALGDDPNHVTTMTTLIGTKETADTDISKTDVAETRSASINMADNVLQRPELKDYSETKVAMGANSIDLSAGNVHTKTISGATTLTFDNPPATGKTGSFTLVLVNGGTNVTFPTVLWDGGDAPSLSASGTDILSFMTMDGGTTWYGFISGLGMA